MYKNIVLSAAVEDQKPDGPLLAISRHFRVYRASNVRFNFESGHSGLICAFSATNFELTHDRTVRPLGPRQNISSEETIFIVNPLRVN
jgi:hypothetical protein